LHRAKEEKARRSRPGSRLGGFFMRGKEEGTAKSNSGRPLRGQSERKSKRRRIRKRRRNRPG
jgi:hypothetical protein